MQKGRVTIDLAVAQFREIGRIIVAFATVEWHLKKLLCELVGLDPKRGRLTLREPRLKEYPALIGDLLSLDAKTLPPEADGLAADLKKQRRNETRWHMASGYAFRLMPCRSFSTRKRIGNPSRPPR